MGDLEASSERRPEQARSYSGSGLNTKAVNDRKHCGSGLAREEARPVKGDSKAYFCAPSSCCRFAWVRLLPAGTLRVSQTLPPMVEP